MSFNLGGRLGAALRTWADRLDPAGAPRALGWSFTIEDGRGIEFREGRGRVTASAKAQRAASERHTADAGGR